MQTPAYFHPHEFEVTVGPGKVLYAYTDSKEESAEWISVISRVIEEAKAAAAPSKRPARICVLLCCLPQLSSFEIICFVVRIWLLAISRVTRRRMLGKVCHAGRHRARDPGRLWATVTV